jgi:hypothetical protein
MTSIIRNRIAWAIAHPEPTVWADGDVTYTPSMVVNPQEVADLLAIIDELAAECEDARQWLASRAVASEVQERLEAAIDHARKVAG